MDSSRGVIEIHKNHIEKTLSLLSSAIRDVPPGDVERIAIATMLQNIYSGIENILRCILEDKGIRIEKTGAWHKNLLAASVNHGIISETLSDNLMEYLVFRHYHVHGYGYMLDWEEMEPLAKAINGTVECFFAELEHGNG